MTGRWRVRIAAALACAGLLAGCTSVVDGHPVALAGSTPTGHSTRSTPTTVTPSGTDSSVASALHARLMTPPKDSVPWDVSWARTTYPTLQQFAQRFYPSTRTTDVVSELRTEGLLAITHETWIDASSTQADLVLERFANDAGALVRYDRVTDYGRGFADTSVVPFGSPGTSVILRRKQIDADGYVPATTYAHVGPVVMELFTFSRTTFDRTRTVAWARQELARLA